MTIRREARAGWSLLRRDMLKFWRERARIVSSLLQPVLMLGIFGLGLKNVLGASAPFQELDYIQYIFPGIIGINVLGISMSSGVTIVADRACAMRSWHHAPSRGRRGEERQWSWVTGPWGATDRSVWDFHAIDE